jgi:hypothetical protein
MKFTDSSKRSAVRVLAVAGFAAVLAACQSMGMQPSYTQAVALSGANEVPPVGTSASGNGTVTVTPEGMVTATIVVTNMSATASHIHVGAAGTNGPVIVPFVKSGDNTFTAPPGAKMTPEQYASYKAGNTYVNVHSAANPGGEIRAQLKGQ